MPDFEKPQTNNGSQESTPEEENEIARKWYSDTSHEGRTSAEFKALREEARKATTLDFKRLRRDRDYKMLIYENSLVDEFLTRQTLTDLAIIHEKRHAIGLSKEQFEKLLTALGPEIQEKFLTEHALREGIGEALREAYKEFTPEEIRDHRKEHTAIRKREIELQGKSIPHKMLTLPGLFPRKKKQ